MQIDCPTCEGNGSIDVCPAYCNGSHVQDHPERCPDCYGDGQVESEPTEDTEDEPSDESMTEAQKHADLQAMIDWQVATVETFGLVIA